MKRNLIFISCVLVLILFSACFVRNKKPQTVLQEVTLEYVKDGDTISVKDADGKVITVRLIGIDAPESVAPESYTEKTGKENNEYGEKAAEHLKELLDGAETLYLEFDEEHADKYDRLLAYVYLTDDGSFDDMINAKMLSDGYATIMEIAPNTKYADRFLELKEDAEKQGKGLWQFGDFMIAEGSEGTDMTIDETDAMNPMAIMVISLPDRSFTVDLENNSSADAFWEKVKTDNLKIEMHDYGNFEKVGDLPWDIPTNDEEISTKPGDLILYQGNKLCIYYGENTWSFTKLGTVNATEEEMKDFFGGEDNITAEIYLEWTE